MIRRAFAGFLSLLLVVGGLTVAPAPVALAAGDQDYQSAARVLNRYGLVQGDQRGFRFADAITRAEVAKVLVYALGQGTQTDQYKGRRDFSDTAGHWAEGSIALAKSLGIMQGYPGGDFRPEAPVSYAETVTAVSRLVGLDPGAEPWPRTYLRPARDAGIIPADFTLDNRLDQAAIRGDVFVLLKRTVADVKNLKGQTLLQLYIDKTAPELTVDPLPKDTQYASLPVSGTATDAATLKINGLPVALADGGYFRQDVPLLIGPNSIRVQALDDAANLKEATVQVNRRTGAPNSITLQGPPSVKVRQTASFIITLLDANGADSADRSKVQANVSPPDAGKFDPKTGIFTAGTKLGTAVITVQSGAAQSSASVTVEAGASDRIVVTPAEVSLSAGESVTFKAAGLDSFGNPVSLSDVTWSADGGTIGTDGRFQATASGTYTVTAAAAGRTGTAKVYPANYQVASIKVTAAASPVLRANGVSETALTATVLDSKGQPVTGYKGVLYVQSSDARIALPLQSAVPVIGGMAQIPVRVGTMAGTARISVSSNLDKIGFANVTTTAPKLQSVRLIGRAMPSTDGKPLGTVEAVAVDQDGNPFRTPLPQTLVLGLTIKPAVPGAGTATFRSNGKDTADIALGDVNPDTGDVRTQVMVQYTPGIGTVMIDGKSKAQGTQGLQVLSGAIAGDQVGLPARLGIEPITDVGAGQTRSIYVNVLDANGYRVTQPGPLTGVVVTLQDQTGQNWPLFPTQSEPGRYRFDVTQLLAGTFTYTARLQPWGATAVAAGQVTAGGIAAVKVLTPDLVIPADNRTEAVLRVELVDGNGNRLTTPPYLVTFRADPNLGVTQPLTNATVTSVGGVAEVRLRAGQVIGQQEFQVVAARPAAPSAPVVTPATVTVTSRGVAQRLQLSYGDNNRNAISDRGDRIGRAAVPFLVDVRVADENGGELSYDSRGVNLTVLNLDTGTVATTLYSYATAGRAAFAVNLTGAANYAFKAESVGLLSGLTMGYGGDVENAIIDPGYHTKAKITIDAPALAAGDAVHSYAWVKVELTDAYDNVTTNQTGHDISVALHLLNNMDFRTGYFTIDGQSNTQYQVNDLALTIPADASGSQPVKLFPGTAGTLSLQADTPDGLHAYATVSVQPLGALAKLDVPQRLVANRGATSHLVAITATDSAGRRLTGMGGTIHVTGLSGDAAIIGYYDPATGRMVRFTVSTKEFDVPVDRGLLQVLVQGSPGSLNAYEAYGAGAPVKNGALRPLFYVQF